jgi:hypothetical protein
LHATQHASTRTIERPAAPVSTPPKPSDRRSHDQQAVRKRERLVAAWLRSLSQR